MKPVPPHHLLSAYLDGELSANEREQVEHLLEASESARQELRELEHIGELLRQLPRESLPQTFASDLLGRCLSEARDFENETQPLKVPVSDASAKSNSSPLSKRKRHWLGLAIVGISATALGWLSMLFWPESSPKSPNELALKSPAETAVDASAFRDSRERNGRPMPMAAGDAAPATALNEARSELAGQAYERKSEQRPLAAEMSQTMRALTAGAEASQAFSLKRSNLKEAPADELVEALDRADEQVAVVKLQVGNRQEALKELQTLLNRHQITFVRAEDRQQFQVEADAVNAAKDSSIVAVYVDASDDRLAAAIRDLQQKAAFQKATIEAPIAVAGLDSLMASPGAGNSLQPRSRMMKSGEASRFGGKPHRSSQGSRSGQTPKPAAIAAPSAEKAPAESAPEPAKNLADSPQETAAPPGKAPAPSLAPAPSTQREVTLSEQLLSALQKQVAASSVRKKEALEEKAAASGKRVQVLFILVDQPAAIGAPASAPSPPADTDGPANR